MNRKIINRIIETSFALYEPDYPINQHFSYIVYKNRILICAKNTAKSHPISRRNPKIGREGEKIVEKNSCSEWNAVKRFIKSTNIAFNKVELYVLRLDGNKKLAYSKPCGSCQKLIKEFCDFKNVYYSGKNGEILKYGI